MPSHSWARGIVTVALLAGIATSAFAQTTVGPEVGLKPYGSFEGSALDPISVTNLKLNLRVPLSSYSQRGGKLHLGFYVGYHNPTFTPDVEIVNRTRYTTWSVDGTTVQILPDFPLETSCNPTQCFYQVYEPDGLIHKLGQLSSGNWISMDATGYIYNPSASVLTDRGGIRYTTQANNNSLIEDPNGNQITGTVNSGVITGWTDTLGRNIPAPPNCDGFGYCTGAVPTTDFSYCTGPLPITKAFLWSLPGPNGGTVNIKACIANIHIVAFANCGTNCNGIDQGEDATQSIVLPNQTAWTFQYDNGGFGDLLKITLPTGGSISYTWRNQVFGNSCPAPGTCVTTRAVTSRTVDGNDGTGPHTWNYQQQWLGSSPTILRTTVTDPLGNDTQHTITGLTNSFSLYETETDLYQGSASSGTAMKKILTDYKYSANPYDGSLPDRDADLHRAKRAPDGESEHCADERWHAD